MSISEERKADVTGYLGRHVTRRQAIKAGGIAVVGLAFSKPIIETIVPKPAFANYVTGGNGCTPGYWKNTRKHDWPDPYDTDNSKWNDVFGPLPATLPAAMAASLNDELLIDILKRGGGCEKALGRHAVAAFLNAKALGSSYGMTANQVVSSVNDALATADCNTIEDLKDNLDALNNAGCPQGAKIAED